MGCTRPSRLVHRFRRLWEISALGLLAVAGALGPVSAAVPAAPPSGPVPAASPSPERSFDLSLPPLRMVLTPQRIQALTSIPSDVSDGDGQDVTIRNRAYHIPVPVGTFRALGWALTHPLDAWRILLPVTVN